MKITQLVLKNFRMFDRARFLFHDHFTVLIGTNGSGKTTVLDALSILLNTYLQGSGIKTGGAAVKKTDARLIMTEKGGQVFRERQEDVWLEATSLLDGTELTWQRYMGDRAGKAKNIVSRGTASRSVIRSGETLDLPLLLYYGSGRLWDVHRNVTTEKPGSQLDAYRYCLDPKSDQNAFKKWFKKLAFTQLQKGTAISALGAVKNAVLACVPQANDFYHNTEMDQLVLHFENGRILPFDHLSDGFRNMVAMVADIAHRASRLNPHYEGDAARRTKGVVLIDELDLHLHPQWQRHVVADLRRAFPEVQFVATTHSPFILQSLEPGQVIDLEQSTSVSASMETHGMAAPGPGQAFSNRSIEDIIEEIMGIPVPQRSHRYQVMYDTAKKYYSMLDTAATSSASEREAIKAQLDELSAPFSENMAYHAFLERKRILAGLHSDTEA